MYRCDDCGELFHESYTESWDLGSHYAEVDLCPICHSEFLTELPWEEAEILERRKKHEQMRFYYEHYPEHKPCDFEERISREEAEDDELEKCLRDMREWV